MGNFLLDFAFLATGALAVRMSNYPSVNCQGSAISGCDGIEQVAGRVEYDDLQLDPNGPPCHGIQYADVYHWVNDSVWVIPGSKENHAALEDYYNGKVATHNQESFRKSLGGVFYEHYSYYAPLSRTWDDYWFEESETKEKSF